MSWYSRGTAALVSGSKKVIALSARFTEFVDAGQGFIGPNGVVYEIDAVVSSTELTLKLAYGGPTNATAAYQVVPIQGYSRELALKAAALLDAHRAVPQEALDHADAAREYKEGAETALAATQGSAAASKIANDAAVAAASASQVAAKTSETNALASKNAAAGSQTAAKTSETNSKASETAAKTSETNSKTSETNSKASETAAAASKTAAQASKESAEAAQTAAVAAKTAADTAKTGADTAKTGADTAKTAAAASQVAAKTSETNSKASEVAAAASQVAAKTSETNSKTSETNAKTSETNALASKNAAAGSTSAAATSEANASTSAAAALASQNAAKTSETNAAASKTTASASQVAAKTSETNAAASAAAAASSQTAASNSAAGSGTSETNAAKSAAAALVSQNAAKTSETNSKTSETAAKASETSSGGSKDAAALSATAAAAAQGKAETARTGAETAQAAAVAAKNAAESAKTGLEAAKAAADGSKVAAAASESSAAASAAAAATSKADADTAKTASVVAQGKAEVAQAAAVAAQVAAVTAKTGADTAKTAADAAKTAAAASQTAAAASQNAAKTSETNSAASAAAALASEGAAKTSETAAAVSQSAAAASQSASKTSETNAAASKTSAGTSETNAAASKTAAAASQTAAKTSETNSAASAAAALASRNASAASQAAAKTSENNAQVSETNTQTLQESAGWSNAYARLAANEAASSAAAALASESKVLDAVAAVQNVTADQGAWNISGGAFPAVPTMTSVWTISVAGTVAGVRYEVGDQLYYSVRTGVWTHIDNVDKVSSVNGKVGAITLVPADVGALPAAGTAVAAAKLATPRKVNGTPFDGTTDITVSTLYDADYRRIVNPPGGRYTTSAATVTGAITIELPVGMNSTMSRIGVKVYEYLTNRSFEVYFGGYNYSAGNWINPFAYILANPGVDRQFNIRFGKNAAGKAVVYIGELATVWNYPQVFVTEVQLGYSTPVAAAWAGDWAVKFTSSEFENVGATITGSQVGFGVAAPTASTLVLRDTTGGISASSVAAPALNSSVPIQVVNGNAAQSVKVGGITVSNSYTDNSPVNGIYSKGVIQSGVASGTAPLVVASTTRVANLNVATAGVADAAPWAGITGKPAVIASGADAAAARVSIGAGTSSLVIGTTAETAKAGNWTPEIADVTGLVDALADKSSLSGTNVFAGANTFNGNLVLKNTTVGVDSVTLDGSTAAGMRVTNASGYVSIAPLNASYAHIYTDRANFIFNTGVHSIAGRFSSYSGDLALQRNTANKLVLGAASAAFTDRVSAPAFDYGFLSTQTVADANAANTGGFTVKYLTSGAANKPAGTDHSLMTSSFSAGYSTQMAADWRTNRWSVRGNNNGVWTNWATLWTSENLTNATAGVAGLMAAADKVKLDGIVAGAQVNAVTTVAGRVGAIVLTSADVGLANADNTADADKPVSTAQQAALNQKANAANAALTGVPTAPTAAATVNTTQIATMAAVQAVNLADTGSSATALTLKTARLIGGVSFNGSANINLPGVNAVGNQSTTGNAATATKIATARDLTIGDTAKSFDGTTALAWSLAEIGAAPDSHTHASVVMTDVRAMIPTAIGTKLMASYFTSKQGITTGTAGATYGDLLVMNGYSDASGGKMNALFMGKGTQEIVHYQAALGDRTWTSAKTLAYTDDNVASATKLLAARSVSITGDASWATSFDGSSNVTGVLTLANSGVVAGSYHNVTVDAKGRVTAGKSVVTGLVTSTTAAGVTNVATTNTNTFLNIIESVGGAAASTGSSTQIVGAGTVTVTSDAAGKITVTGAQAITGNAATATAQQTARTINNTSYNGTANIVTALWGTARNITIGGTTKSVNGSANVDWTADEITNPTPTLSSINGGQIAGNRNFLMNGAMQIHERDVPSPIVSAGGPASAFGADRWRVGGAFNGSLELLRGDSGLSGTNLQYWLQCRTIVGDASITANQYAFVEQKIEGINIYPLIGNTFTLSFFVRSSKIGVHCVSFRNGVADRSYIAQYTVNAANTWEYKTITVVGGLTTDGKWALNESVGLHVTWTLAAGTDFRAAANTWVNANDLATTSQVNCLDVANNVFGLTGCQIELGSVATPFERVPFAVELANCSRYWQRTAYNLRITAHAGGAYLQDTLSFSPMRAMPTVDGYGYIQAHNVQMMTLSPLNRWGGRVEATAISPGDAYVLGGIMNLDAEL